MEDNILQHVSDILGDTNYGLSGREIIRYFMEYSIKYDIKILHDKYPFDEKIPNKRTAVFQNLKCFNHQQQLKIIEGLCELSKFHKNDDVVKLRLSIIKIASKEKSPVNSKIEETTEHWLKGYPKIAKIHKEAVKKFENGQYQRNILDDMRLSLELLLKDILKNDKSLENNSEKLLKKLKEKNTSIEFRNMLNVLINYYSNYQNEHVKHNDDVREIEMEFIINITNSIMIFLIKNFDEK